MSTDFTLSDHGSIMLLLPVSERAKSWVDEHLSDDALLFGKATVVEPRYLGDIVVGILEEGMTI